MNEEGVPDISYMALAIKMANRSNCQKRMVGCVIVKHDKILARGFNIVPEQLEGLDEISVTGLCPGKDICTKMGQRSCATTVHAEIDAMSKAPQGGLMGATIYVTLMPCSDCFKAIVSSGIKHIVWFDSKPHCFTDQYYMGMDFYQACEKFGIKNYPCKEMYNSFHKNFMDESKRKTNAFKKAQNK